MCPVNSIRCVLAVYCIQYIAHAVGVAYTQQINNKVVQKP